jgi:anti-sigma B factor antagonist
MTEVKVQETATTIVLPERVDSATAGDVEQNILAALQPGAQMIIDGHQVGYMSAAGVRTLATVLHRAEERQAHVVFCRFTGAAADCLLVSGFNELFDIAETAEDASSKLEQRKTKETQPPAERLHRERTAG